MMRFSPVFICLLCLFHIGFAQQSRIKEGAFPEKAHALISEYLENAKRIRFYQKTDSTRKNFSTKFKKGRLHYTVEFNENGDLEVVVFIIKEYDIPEDTWNTITTYLNSNYPKLHIKKIQQQHPLVGENPKKTLHEAFQNLMLPYINYEIVFLSKKEGKSQFYEALFNAEGDMLNMRKSI